MNRLAGSDWRPSTEVAAPVPHDTGKQVVALDVLDSGLVIIPWHLAGEETLQNTGNYNLFEGIFGQGKAMSSEKSSVLYSHFVRRVFGTSPSDVTPFIDRGISLVSDGDQGVDLHPARASSLHWGP